MSDNHEHDKGWADSSGFRKGLVGVLVIACLAAAAAGLNAAWKNPHPHFDAEEFPAFFAVWGFVCFAFIVLAGQHLRKLVGRKEDYYEERE